MSAKRSLDAHGRAAVTEWDLAKRLYQVDWQFDGCEIEDPAAYNKALYDTGMPWEPLKRLEEITCSPEEFHKANQSEWFMPEHYKSFDIAEWVIAQCKTPEELERVGMELIMFQERDMFNLLRYLIYLVDVMRANDIVWGVGRGSSVASHVLYLIGIHRINSLKYNLDIKEFLK